MPKSTVITNPNQQDIVAYKNQKVININKLRHDKNFIQVGSDECFMAMKALSPSAFKLYVYLMDNKHGYKMALSQVRVSGKTGIKKTAYHSAVNELIDKGYLVKYDSRAADYDYYIFYSTPLQFTDKDEYDYKVFGGTN